LDFKPRAHRYDSKRLRHRSIHLACFRNDADAPGLELVARLDGELRERDELVEPEVQAPRYVACWGGTNTMLAEANAALARAARAEAEVAALRRRLQLAGPVIDPMPGTVGTGSGA